MVGVFDSGIGGLSVLKSIALQLPGQDLYYIADTAHMPYGEKPDSLILERSLALSHHLKTQGARALVVACNTASASAIATLRQTFDLPIVGIEPALKPARAVSHSGVIGILATRSTLQSAKFMRLLEQHRGDTKVLSVACPKWVELVEAGELSGEQSLAAVAEVINPLVDRGVDTVVLGCTHFPFLKPLILEVAPRLEVIEPSQAVAAQLERLLRERNLLESKAQRSIRFLTTGNQEHFALQLAQLWGEGFELEATDL
jgi:glutamate racemase